MPYMALSGTARALLVYNRAAATPAFANLQQAEKDAFLAQLQQIYGDDTAYLVQNTVVVTTALSVPSPIAVQTIPYTGTGATTAPGRVIGNGSIL